MSEALPSRACLKITATILVTGASSTILESLLPPLESSFGFNVGRIHDPNFQKTVPCSQRDETVMARRFFRYFLKRVKRNLARRNFLDGQTGNFRFRVKNIVFGNSLRFKRFFQGYSGFFGLGNNLGQFALADNSIFD